MHDEASPEGPLARWFCAPDALAAAMEEGRPLAFVDLAQAPEALAMPLPPLPVIGIGDARHPLAVQLDAVIEPPIPAPAVVRAILAAPRAAAVAVGLLRSAAALAPSDALVAESLAMATLQGSAEHARWLAARPPLAGAEPGTLHVARHGDVLTIAIDRPGARNAIDRRLRDALHEALMLAVHDRAIAAVRLTGVGRCFGIGADLAEFGTTRDPATAHLIRMRTLPALPLVRRPDLLAAHVQGACVGASLELAAFARRLTATRTAWFQLPELALGLIPGAGGTVSIPRRIGRQRTALLLLSGRRIDAATALRWGLVDAVVEDAPGDDRGAHPL